MFCLCGFSLGSPVSPTVKTRTAGLSLVSTLGTGLESGVGPRALCCGCPLLLRDGLNAENTFQYVTNKVPLPLPLCSGSTTADDTKLTASVSSFQAFDLSVPVTSRLTKENKIFFSPPLHQN